MVLRKRHCAKNEIFKKNRVSPIFKSLIKIQNHLFINNRILLCLSNANQPTSSSEFKIACRKPETADCKWRWETTQKVESSQCITKFATDDS